MKTKGKAIPVIQDSCCDCEELIHTHVDTGEVRERAALLSALADPTRLGIMAMLADLDEPLCVCDIVSHFELGQPTISHHLRILREANLVTTEKRGLWVYYSINRRILDGAASYLDRLVAGRALVGAGNRESGIGI
jgi:ArsR family transcriptional regulator